MKKIIILLILFLFSNPAFAIIDVYGLNLRPYKPYRKQISLKKLYTTNFKNEKIEIIKNLYQFEYAASNLGIPYEYLIKNNTNETLLLKGIESDTYFYNRDINKKHSKRFLPMAKARMESPEMLLPCYKCYYDIITEVERHPFSLDFPKNYTIHPGNTLRILCIGMDKNRELGLVLIFEKNGIEEQVGF